MPNASSQATGSASGEARAGAEMDFDLCLVVSASPIDRIVMTRIAERAGLRVVAAAPEDAGAGFAAHRPGTVILDGDPGEATCRAMIEAAARLRETSGVGAPFVILVARAGAPRQRVPKGGPIDHVVAKPLTPDRLEPLLRSLLDRVRD